MPKTAFCAIVWPMQTLTATKRSKAEPLASIRNNGMVPAVVYGALVENTSISVVSTNFTKVFKAAGESNTIVLDIEGKKIDVLIHDVQVDPVKGFPIHVDFLAIDMSKPVEVTIPLVFSGVAPAEKSGLGSLVKVLHEIEIEALPKNLPHEIMVDVSTLLDLSTQIHASDIVLPAGVTLITSADEVVALVAAAREEKEEESAPIDLSAIEVEKRGKKEEEAPQAE